MRRNELGPDTNGLKSEYHKEIRDNTQDIQKMGLQSFELNFLQWACER